MWNIRKQQKAERDYYQRAEVQACRVCGRLFVRRGLSLIIVSPSFHPQRWRCQTQLL
jgi:hypothetical protein